MNRHSLLSEWVPLVRIKSARVKGWSKESSIPDVVVGVQETCRKSEGDKPSAGEDTRPSYSSLTSSSTDES